MSMTTKRKAQGLVRQGRLEEAIEEMREGVGEGDADPYDHVYLGDLLMRVDETDAGILSYETAIRSYEEVGLFRNAIAIGKKLLRVDGKRHEIHRTLGRLYDHDDLQGEAIPHYLSYLDSLSQETLPPEEFLQVLDRAASITGSKVEVALRLTDHFLRLRKGDRAAALLDSVADHCDRAGSEDIAADLRQRAREAAAMGSGESNETVPEVSDDGHVTIDLDTVDLNVKRGDLDEVPPIPLDDSLFGEPEIPPIPTTDGSAESGGSTATRSAVADIEDRVTGEDPATGEGSGSGEASSTSVTGLELEHFPGRDRETPPTASPLEFGAVDLTAGMEAALGSPTQADSAEASATDGAEDSAEPGAKAGADDGVGASAEGSVDDGVEDQEKVYDLDLGETADFGDVDLKVTADLSATDEDSSANVWEIESEGAADLGAVDLEPASESTEFADLETFDLAVDPVDCGPGDTSTVPAEAAPPCPTPAGSSSAVSLESADDDYLEGRWSDARSKYESILESDPNQRRVLSKLVETVRYLEDVQGETHYLILLGDAWIAEDEYEEAMNCFLTVLRHDPENETAKRRLARFRDLGVVGAEGIDEATSNSVPSLLETGGTEVAVRNSDGAEFRSEDWVELEGLLEEFNAGLKEQMDEGDYQAHYDLAVSHHSMGLLEEALESIDQALSCSEIPLGVQRQARELRGGCLLGLKRNREAVHEYRETLDQAGDDVDARRTALHNLGRALESVEEWQEAYQTFSQLRIEAPGHLDVEERMRRLQERLSDLGNPEAA